MLTIDDYCKEGYDTSVKISHFDKYSKDEFPYLRFTKKGTTTVLFRSFISRRYDFDTVPMLFSAYANKYYADFGSYNGLWNHFIDFIHTDFDLTFGYKYWDYLQGIPVITEMLTLGVYVKNLKIAMFQDLLRFMRYDRIEDTYELSRGVIYRMLRKMFYRHYNKVEKFRDDKKGLSYSNLRFLKAMYEIYGHEKSLELVNDTKFRMKSKSKRVRVYKPILTIEDRLKQGVITDTRLVNDTIKIKGISDNDVADLLAELTQ